ncbi:methyltransferase domain-containing protein [Candidatus Pelagibacter sp.]|nr:methyltransferase domain-containing protein [Candidatus Pelagibacter sp.]
MTIRVNFGCGMTPTEGWVNYDNSFAIKLANSSFLYLLAKSLRILNEAQIENVEWNKKHKIHFADATKKIPLRDNSVECLYTSHMLEHISREGVVFFLNEVIRFLEVDGVLRVAVPDLRIAINNYLAKEDADSFMKEIHVEAQPISKLIDKFRLFVTGYRHHQWMYDGKSLSILMKNSGFRNVRVYKKGQTSIKNPKGLNLFERSEESVYVEGIK